MFLDPNKFLEEINIKENISVADFGCGPGGWTIPLSKFLKRGKVYSFDILSGPLEALESRISLEGLRNIEVKERDLEKEKGTGLPNNYLDLVLIPNLLFQCEDKKAIIAEAKRIIKQSGQIIIIDWKKESPFGPNDENLVSIMEMREIARSLLLKEKSLLIDVGEYHYCLVFEK